MTMFPHWNMEFGVIIPGSWSFKMAQEQTIYYSLKIITYISQA